MSKRKAKKAGVGLIFGFIGGLISFGVFGRENKIAALIVTAIFVLIGYFGLGNRLSNE